ncbi:S8 family peptidase [Streptomyces sp. CWNU-52B]|uniref:S8 family peptidase n=1 Tax=unclassified Streptomyces TaxID=2593676 RepID=UPI0039BFE9B5
MAVTRTRRLHRAGGLAAVMTAAALSASALPAHAAPEGQLSDSGRAGSVSGSAHGSVSGSYIVTLKGGTQAPSKAGKALATKYGAKISHTYSTALNGYAVRAGEQQARRLAADSRVASVSRDATVSVTHQQSDPPWGLDRIDQRDLPLDRSYTWPESAGQGVTAYVIDTGVRVSHQEFGGRASSGWDFVDDDAVAQDGQGHGTHVAGTIAGTTYGVAKQAHVVAVRVLDDTGAGTLSQVLAGIDWVTRNARKPAVANMSLGGLANPQLDAAVRNSIASGVTYTIAAGNDDLPASLFSPARVKEAITVGASDQNDARAYFSNWGPGLDLFAPGVDVTSASPASDTGTATFSGTSMASPHAAGAAALYLADHATAAPAEVGEALVERAAAGTLSDPGLGSPNKLLQVNNP